MDGRTWSPPVAKGQGYGPYTLIAVGPVQAKVIRITLTSAPSDAPPWTISRTQVLQEGQSATIITRKPTPNPFE
jgi:hypothetical protein